MNVHVHASDYDVTGRLSKGIAWRIACATKHARDSLAHAPVRSKADRSQTLAEPQPEDHAASGRAFRRVPLRPQACLRMQR